MKFLVLQHLDIEPLALIGDVIVESGHELQTVMLEEGVSIPDPFDGFDGLVVMGGPQSANDRHLSYIRDEVELLKRAIELDFPVIGICLGAQLLAKAAGAEIVRSPVRELGWYPVYPSADSAGDPLFSMLPAEGLQVFQWHGESFTQPEGASLLATHPDVRQQAFRIGNCQYGMQFHMEVDAELIEVWIAAGESERSHLGETGINAIRKDNDLYLQAARGVCREMVQRWLLLCAERKD